MTKPTSRKIMHSSNFLDSSYCINFGQDNTPRKISGFVQRKGVIYSDAYVLLSRKSDFQPIAITKPNITGYYEFLGLNSDITCFLSGFDLSKDYNAVIQDSVVPK
ncbi:hypothetical protein ACX1NX_02835 [Acinetobacter sp. ANC 5383]